jgi:hypothetical protein
MVNLQRLKLKMPGFPSRAFFAFAIASYPLPASHRRQPEKQGKGVFTAFCIALCAVLNSTPTKNQLKAFVTPHYRNGPSLVASTAAATRAWLRTVLSLTFSVRAIVFSSIPSQSSAGTSRACTVKSEVPSYGDPNEHFRDIAHSVSARSRVERECHVSYFWEDIVFDGRAAARKCRQR